MEISEPMRRARKSEAFKQSQCLWILVNPCAGLANQKLSSNPNAYGNSWTNAQGSQIKSFQAIPIPEDSLNSIINSMEIHRTSFRLNYFLKPVEVPGDPSNSSVNSIGIPIEIPFAAHWNFWGSLKSLVNSMEIHWIGIPRHSNGYQKGFHWDP